MLLLIDPSSKRAFAGLFSEQPVDIPPWQHGSTKPLTVALVDPIDNPQTARLFEPRDITTGSARAALGRGFLLPVAGTWFILSGIALTSGTVTNTKRYKIISYVAGDVFTNIGAGSNATGVIFTATGTTPTTWTNGSQLQEATADIVYNPSAAQIQTALDATAWETAAGGITVTGEDGFFYFTFTTAGARSAMHGDTSNLAPLSIADFGELLPGSTNVAEVQILRLVQNPGAYVSMTLRNDAAAAGVALVQTGGAGLNAKVRVSLTTRQSGLLTTGGIYTIVAFVAGDSFTNVGAASNATGITFVATGTTPTTWSNGSALRRVDALAPYDGQFSITVRSVESAMLDFDASAEDVVAALEALELTSGLLITGAKYKIVERLGSDVFTNVGAAANTTGTVFTASGTTPTTWTSLSRLSPVAAGNVSVSRESVGQYLIVFQGDMANTAMGSITADGSALRVIPTLSGTLDLRTSGMDLLLGGDTEVAIVFEIETTPFGESVQKVFREDGTLIDSIFDPSNTAPPNVPYFTDLRYLRSDAASSLFTGNTLTIDSGATFAIASGANFGLFGTTVTAKTGTGSIVLHNTPAFVTPLLGTPTSGVLTNCTGLPISTGVAGLGTGAATALAVNVGSAGAVLVFNGALGTPSSGILSACTVDGTNLVGYRGIPPNSQSAAYTTVLADAGKQILHPTADNNARTFTIDSNANVAYPIGTAITFVNEINTVTIAITSDTLVLAGAGTTGSRTLAAMGIATAVKKTSTSWIISGTGLT